MQNVMHAFGCKTSGIKAYAMVSFFFFAYFFTVLEWINAQADYVLFEVISHLYHV